MSIIQAVWLVYGQLVKGYQEWCVNVTLVASIGSRHPKRIGTFCHETNIVHNMCTTQSAELINSPKLIIIMFYLDKIAHTVVSFWHHQSCVCH